MTASATFSIGVDFGTNSVRALVVDTATGEEIATAVHPYAAGMNGIILDDHDPNLARQDPADYLAGFNASLAEAVTLAKAHPSFDPGRVVGIGVDTTGSTPIPVDRAGTALGLLPEFRKEPAAMAWLWKDHTAHAEAAEITDKARSAGLPYLSTCGGTYSSEWFWSKALHCERTNPRVAKAAHSWVEQCDYVVGAVTGKTDPTSMSRGVCAAGHKAMYHPSWGGLPSAAFLEGLSPDFSRIREHYAHVAVPSDRVAGGLTPAIARAVGLPPNLPVAVGAIDAHVGAVGCGITPGTLVKIIGTSTCDCMVWPMNTPLADIPGVCGIVPESILPGMHGIEAGQSAVGDIFNWFVQRIAPSGYGSGDEMHRRLSEAASALAPGESGLVALDWHHGNRTVLVDPLLTGLTVGQTLTTTPPEIYRALIEATAFGALTIIDRIQQHGVRIDEVINCGGIADKSPLTMQIYADVTNRPMKVSRSAQTCALGAAIFGAVVGRAHASVADAQRAMTAVKPHVFRPIPAHADAYRRLFGIYSRLHDAFGVRGSSISLDGVMKELILIRQTARAGRSG